MQKVNRKVLRYLREIRRNLPCSIKMKNQLLAQLRGSIVNYLNEYPDADQAQIIQQFGTPEQIAASWLYEMDQKTLILQLCLKNRIAKTITACTVMIVLLFSATMGYLLYDNYCVDNGYVEIIPGTPTIIEED